MKINFGLKLITQMSCFLQLKSFKFIFSQPWKTKYDVLTSENRIRVSDTIDTEDSSSINNSNIKKVKKNRLKIK
jgi:hypothetical protein